MHDIKDIRKDPDKYRDGLRKRGQDPDVIDELLEIDTFNRAIKTIEQEAQSKRNKISEQYGRLKALQKKGETTYVDAEGDTVTIEFGLSWLEYDQIMVDIDEGLAKFDARIAYYDVEQARMVEGFAKQMGFANADALVEEMKKEANDKDENKAP